MGRMNDLSLVVAELKECGEKLIKVSDSLAELFSSAEKTDAPKETTAPKAGPKTMTLEEVRAVVAEKSRSGHTAAIKALLEKYGAVKLSDIPAEKYAALLADVEVL